MTNSTRDSSLATKKKKHPQRPANVHRRAPFRSSLRPRCPFSLSRSSVPTHQISSVENLSQRCDTAGAEDVDPSAVLKTAAPDICNEEVLFAPRSKAQEDANVGAVEERSGAGKPSLPPGAWVEAAKELVPPPPPPEVKEKRVSRTNSRLREGPSVLTAVLREMYIFRPGLDVVL